MPTIAEDLDRLAACIRGETGCSEMDEDAAALTRIRAALGDREHLEYGCQLLVESTEGSDGWQEWPRLAHWMEAERARQSGEGE